MHYAALGKNNLDSSAFSGMLNCGLFHFLIMILHTITFICSHFCKYWHHFVHCVTGVVLWYYIYKKALLKPVLHILGACSARLHIIDTGSAHFPAWKALWRNKTPPKVAFFVWTATVEAILTQIALGG